MRSRRVGVLGAGGFLGSHLVSALLALEEDEIDVVDLTFAKLETADPRVRKITGRIDQPGLIGEIVDRCHTVFSLTALCNPALYNTTPLEVIDASYTDLLPLVERCATTGTRLIHFSTCEVYGRSALDDSARPMGAMNEETTGFFLGPVHRERWTYACAKQLLERVIWAHGHHRALDFTIVRPFNVIGPRMDFLPGIDGEGVPRVLACFINALLRGRELRLVNGGSQKRSFIAVQDFTDAVVRILQRPEACRGEILNIGNPANETTIRKLAESIARVFSVQVPGAPAARLQDVSGEELYGPGYDDSQQRIPDIGKAQALLSWQPRLTLEQALPSIVSDYVARYQPLLAPGGPQPRLQPAP
jgi:UDP-apiose/xylose synthase